MHLLIQLFPKTPGYYLIKEIMGSMMSFHCQRKSELIETLGEGLRSEDLAGCLRIVNPNESGSLNRFAFVGWCVDEEVSLDSAEEVERLVGWY